MPASVAESLCVSSAWFESSPTSDRESGRLSVPGCLQSFRSVAQGGAGPGALNRHGDRSSRTLRRAAGGWEGGGKQTFRHGVLRDEVQDEDPAALLRAAGEAGAGDLSSQEVTGSRRSFLFVDSIAFFAS